MKSSGIPAVLAIPRPRIIPAVLAGLFASLAPAAADTVFSANFNNGAGTAGDKNANFYHWSAAIDRSDESELQPVAVKVQVSNDLVTWNPADDIAIGDVSDAGPIGGTGASYTVAENGAAPNTIVVTIPKGAATKKFARVVATQ